MFRLSVMETCRVKGWFRNDWLSSKLFLYLFHYFCLYLLRFFNPRGNDKMSTLQACHPTDYGSNIFVRITLHTQQLHVLLLLLLSCFLCDSDSLSHLFSLLCYFFG